MAQELLNTFGTDLGEVALVPGTGGIFVVTAGDRTVWDRKTDGGFPDIVTLKQRVRDVVDPGRDLGHADRGERSVTNGHPRSSIPVTALVVSGGWIRDRRCCRALGTLRGFFFADVTFRGFARFNRPSGLSLFGSRSS